MVSSYIRSSLFQMQTDLHSYSGISKLAKLIQCGQNLGRDQTPLAKKRSEDLIVSRVWAKHQVIQNTPFIYSILHDDACEVLEALQHLPVTTLAIVKLLSNSCSPSQGKIHALCRQDAPVIPQHSIPRSVSGADLGLSMDCSEALSPTLNQNGTPPLRTRIWECCTFNKRHRIFVL